MKTFKDLVEISTSSKTYVPSGGNWESIYGDEPNSKYKFFIHPNGIITELIPENQVQSDAEAIKTGVKLTKSSNYVVFIEKNGRKWINGIDRNEDFWIDRESFRKTQQF